MKEKIDAALEVVKGRIPALNVHSDWQKAGQAVVNLMQAKALYAALTKPTDELVNELEFMLGRVRPNLGATELQQVTQAVLHLMQAKAQGEAVEEVWQTLKQPAKTTKTKSD